MRGNKEIEHSSIHEIQGEILAFERIYLQQDHPVLKRRVPRLPRTVYRRSEDSMFIQKLPGLMAEMYPEGSRCLVLNNRYSYFRQK